MTLTLVWIASLVVAVAAVDPPFGDPYLARHIADPEYDPNPEYSYSYNVQDPVTGDFKSQSETRIGDAVKGHYTLADSDGTQRIVDYIADALNGFKATVTKVPLGPESAAPIAAKNAALPVPPISEKPIAPHLGRLPSPYAYPGGPGYNYPGFGYPYRGFGRGYSGYPGYFPYQY